MINGVIRWSAGGVTGRVPLARRTLLQDRRRAALAAGGVAAALLLVLLLQGIFDGAIRQTTAYLRSSPADVLVSEQGVRTMHMSVSVLSARTPAEVRRVPGVAWAEGIRFTTTFLAARDGRQQLSYVIGYDQASGRAGPHELTSGQPPRSGQIAVEQVAADRLGLHVGDPVSVFGTRLRLSGVFRGGTTITNTIAFITGADFASLRGPSLAYVLVGASPGVDAAALAGRVSAALPGDTVQTRSQFVAQEASLVTDMGADLMQIMSIVAFLIAQAVIGLTLYTLTQAKLRDHAVVKALGASTPRLAGVVVAQAVWSVALAVALAAALAVAAARIVNRLNPAITITIEPASLARVTLGALLIGCLGAVIPLRRVVTIDPASAFART